MNNNKDMDKLAAKINEIFDMTLQRLEIPIEPEKANFRQAMQMMYLRYLNENVMPMGITTCGASKFIEVTRVYLDMLDLMLQEVSKEFKNGK